VQVRAATRKTLMKAEHPGKSITARLQRIEKMCEETFAGSAEVIEAACSSSDVLGALPKHVAATSVDPNQVSRLVVTSQLPAHSQGECGTTVFQPRGSISPLFLRVP